jgi:hypothetical protein
VLVGRGVLPLAGFVAYVVISMLMFNEPRRPLLPPPFGGRVQLSDVVFPLAIAPWLAAGLPGLQRVVWTAGVPAAVWLAGTAFSAAFAAFPREAWLETAVFAYLGVVLVWGAAVLAEPQRLRCFARWWVAIVGGVVLLGLAGWLVAVLSGHPNVLVEWRTGIPLFGDRLRVRSTLAPTSRLLMTLLIAALPGVYTLWRRGTTGERRWCGWLIVAMSVVGVLTLARGIVEYLALLGLLALLPWRGRRRTAAAAVVAIYAVAILGVVAVSTWHVTGHELTWRADRTRSLGGQLYYGTLPDVGVETLDLHVEWVHDFYFILKRMAWRAFLERPLAGWGPNSFPEITARARESGAVPPGLRFTTAHSEAFTVAAEMGVAGLVALAAFWVLILRATWPRGDGGFAGALARHQALGICAVLLTTVHLDVMRFRFVWIALALGIAAARCAGEEIA